MRYLTKEWCNLCQLTELHFGLRAHKDVRVLNESVYQRLRKRKEKAFLKQEKEKKVQSVLKDFKLAQEKENIPENIRERFSFHDCKVKNIEKKKDVTILLDTSDGFTEDNKIIFHNAKIIKEDTAVNGCWWIYEELYNTHNGYEAHMMFVDETNSYIELTIASKGIIVEKVHNIYSTEEIM